MVPPNNVNEATQMPHIYKKGQILKLKKLNEGLDRTNRKYLFSSSGSGITSVINHCNNLNQIVGRNFLGISKLLHYFGISKDPSEKLSKGPTAFNQFSKDYPSLKQGGEDNTKVLKELKTLFENLNSKIKNLEEKIDSLKKTDGNNDLSKQLKNIEESLKKILG